MLSHNIRELFDVGLMLNVPSCNDQQANHFHTIIKLYQKVSSIFKLQFHRKGTWVNYPSESTMVILHESTMTILGEGTMTIHTEHTRIIPNKSK